MPLRLPLIIMLALAGCAHSAPIRAPLRAPNPNGCYAIVFEEPLFEGVGEVLNGPARLSNLEHLPQTNERTWSKRIRSVRVGPAARVTAYVETAFKGPSQRFEPATNHPRLAALLSARIQSLDVTCVDRPKDRP